MKCPYITALLFLAVGCSAGAWTQWYADREKCKPASFTAPADTRTAPLVKYDQTPILVPASGIVDVWENCPARLAIPGNANMTVEYLHWRMPCETFYAGKDIVK